MPIDRKAYEQAYYKAHKEKYAEREKAYRIANPERKKINNRKLRAANPEKWREYYRQWRSANREKYLKQSRIRRTNNIEQARKYTREYLRKWRKTFPEKRRAYYREYYKQNAIKISSAAKKWRLLNPGKVRAWNAGRRARKIQATPKWLTVTQLQEIKCIYIKADNLSLTVDHIIPLKGKTVCGLHVPWNLQLLSSIENSRKKNRFEQGI